MSDEPTISLMDDDIIDPSEVRNEDSDLRFAHKNRGNDRIKVDSANEVVEIFGDLEDKSDWTSLSNISYAQAEAVAKILNYPEMFPNIYEDPEMKEHYESLVHDYLRALVSVDSLGREQTLEAIKHGLQPGQRTAPIDDDE